MPPPQSPASAPPSGPLRDLRLVLWRGLRRRCPQCAHGRLLAGWYSLADQCPACNLPFSDDAGTTWGFMYYTTAFLTGLIIVGMFLIRPHSVVLGQIVVGFTAALVIIGSMPTRKALAIAI